MDKTKLISDDLVLITPYPPGVQVCFPPVSLELNSVIKDKYHIMKVREWVFCYRKQKVNVDVFKPNEAIASRYSVKQVDNRFYGVLNIEIKKSE